MYKCFRCGYSTPRKNLFEQHTKRTTICKPKLEDIPVNYELFLKKRNEEKVQTQYQCNKCHKFLKSKHNLDAHVLKCEMKIEEEIVPQSEIVEEVSQETINVDKPEIITLNDKKYYRAEDLKKLDEVFFHGCAKSIRLIVQIKTISEEDYIIVKYVGEEMKECARTYNRGKLLISEEWTLKNFPKLSKGKVKNIVEEVPERVYLNEDETFMIGDKEVNIEMVGERSPKKLFMLVKDVARELNIESLYKILVDTRTNYLLNEDYKYFISKRVTQNKKENEREIYISHRGFQRLIINSNNDLIKNNQIIFFNWINYIVGQTDVSGPFKIIRTEKQARDYGCVYIVCSPVLNACKIGMWNSSIEALKRRYITPYGKDVSIYSKQVKNPRIYEKKMHDYFSSCRIANELFMNCYYEDYKYYLDNVSDDEDLNDVFQRNSELETVKISCIYLLSIGTVKDLRTILNISEKYSDENIVMKYGRTDDLQRRISEHENTWTKLKVSSINLKYFGMIDKKFCSQAEKNVKDKVEEMKTNFSFEKMDELICVSEKQTKELKKFYEEVSSKYIGNFQNFKDIICDVNHRMDLTQKNEEILNQKHEIEILKKNEEINILKHKLEMMRCGGKA